MDWAETLAAILIEVRGLREDLNKRPTATAASERATSAVKVVAQQLHAAGTALDHSAAQLKEDGKIFRAKEAKLAAIEAHKAAEDLVGSMK